MDHLVSHTSGLGRHSRWRGGGFLKVFLRPLRKLIRDGRNSAGQDGKASLTVASEKEVEREGSRFIPEPQIRRKSVAIPRPKSCPALRNYRHDSQHSQLSSIPETDDHDGVVAPLSKPQELMPSQATLLGIPAELRNEIYKHVFRDWQSSQPLTFLRTCRQIHEEAANLAFAETIFRIHTEHWPDTDFFQARYVSQLTPTRLESIQHLALRLPRGAPFDCYNSRRLHVNLPILGFKLSSLTIFSHYPRPLPRISDYGGVMEGDLCQWLVDTLYAMPSLTHLRILNYESPAPGLFDIPSPRLVRLLRGQIFRDVIAERQSLSEDEFQWHCHCERDRAYSVYSAKLGRTVNISFENGDDLESYGLGHIFDLREHLNPEELLRAVPPDMSPEAYASLLAQKNSNSSRRRLSKTLSSRQNRMSRSSVSMIDQLHELRTPTPPAQPDAPQRRRRLSKRYSLQSQPTQHTTQTHEEEERQRQRHNQHRQSWHAGAVAASAPG